MYDLVPVENVILQKRCSHSRLHYIPYCISDALRGALCCLPKRKLGIELEISLFGFNVMSQTSSLDMKREA